MKRSSPHGTPPKTAADFTNLPGSDAVVKQEIPDDYAEPPTKISNKETPRPEENIADIIKQEDVDYTEQNNSTNSLQASGDSNRGKSALVQQTEQNTSSKSAKELDNDKFKEPLLIVKEELDSDPAPQKTTSAYETNLQLLFDSKEELRNVLPITKVEPQEKIVSKKISGQNARSSPEPETYQPKNSWRTVVKESEDNYVTVVKMDERGFYLRTHAKEDYDSSKYSLWRKFDAVDEKSEGSKQKPDEKTSQGPLQYSSMLPDSVPPIPLIERSEYGFHRDFLKKGHGNCLEKSIKNSIGQLSTLAYSKFDIYAFRRFEVYKHIGKFLQAECPCVDFAHVVAQRVLHLETLCNANSEACQLLKDFTIKYEDLKRREMWSTRIERFFDHVHNIEQEYFYITDVVLPLEPNYKNIAYLRLPSRTLQRIKNNWDLNRTSLQQKLNTYLIRKHNGEVFIRQLQKSYSAELVEQGREKMAELCRIIETTTSDQLGELPAFLCQNEKLLRKVKEEEEFSDE